MRRLPGTKGPEPRIVSKCDMQVKAHLASVSPSSKCVGGFDRTHAHRLRARRNVIGKEVQKDVVTVHTNTQHNRLRKKIVTK